MDEIKVVTANTCSLPSAREWFMALVDWTGNGAFWSSCCVRATMLEAEMDVRNSQGVKQARIVRVVLPCLGYDAPQTNGGGNG
jgi:hypothetical protein